MSDQNEPPKRHVRMKRGRARKEPMPEHPTYPALAAVTPSQAKERLYPITAPINTPQVNSVIQVIKGEHTGRLAIVGRIDPDCYKCYVVLFGGTRDYLDVRADEFALIGKAKKAFKNAIPEHPLPSGTPNINSDTSPFGGFK